MGKPRNGLTTKQAAFVAAYIGEANGNGVEAARIAGYRGSRHTLEVVASENLRKPEIATEIDAYKAAIKRRGIAYRQNRIDALNDRWQRMTKLIEARGNDMAGEVAGGELGLMVRKIKSIGSGNNQREVWEYAFDDALMKELREHEKQGAQELGEWIDKGEISGKDGAPLTIVIGERPDGPA